MGASRIGSPVEDSKAAAACEREPVSDAEPVCESESPKLLPVNTADVVPERQQKPPPEWNILQPHNGSENDPYMVKLREKLDVPDEEPHHAHYWKEWRLGILTLNSAPNCL